MDQFGLVVTTPAEPPNGVYEAEDRGHMGKQLHAKYPNGYGASLIQGPYSYGGPEGKYELAVTHPGNEDGWGSLCYATPVTSDVIGWLVEEEVVVKLHEIAKLPPNADCSHDRRDDWDPLSDTEHEAGIGDVLDSMLGYMTKGLR